MLLGAWPQILSSESCLEIWEMVKEYSIYLMEFSLEVQLIVTDCQLRITCLNYLVVILVL